MNVVTITDSLTGSTARIAAGFGFNCFDFQAQVGNEVVSVLDCEPGFPTEGMRPSRSGIPILFPFPNRIRAGRYFWGGREYAIQNLTPQGHAIHGFCLDRPWRVIAQGSDFVTGQFQLSVDAPDRLADWPSDFVLEVDYELTHNRLRANFRVMNPGETDLPWGLGTHAYFRLPLSSKSQLEAVTVEAPVTRMWECKDNLPTGRIVDIPPEKQLRNPVGVRSLKLDDVFTDLDFEGPQFDCSIVDERAGLQLTQTCPPIFREIVAFTPPERAAICLEPYTCVTDAINLARSGSDTGLRVLTPGTEFHTWIDLSVSKILA
jgi:aldose 1-epimerase